MTEELVGLEVLKALGRSSLSRQFYLAGGTGLALQLHHRISRDLDLFTLKPNYTLSVNRILEMISKTFLPYEYSVAFRSAEQIDLRIRGVKVSFIAYPFRIEESFTTISSFPVAHPADIAAMKAYTMGRRAVARDYIDLYFALKKPVVTLDELIKKSERIFQLEGEKVFDGLLFAKQLAYTSDLDDKELALSDIVDKKITWKDIETALSKIAKGWIGQKLMDQREVI